MGNCIICGTSTDGPICDVHQEDAVFEFEGDDPSQLTAGRYYKGTVDGYADFGVFVDIGNVTGLLHRSKLDRRLDSLDWGVGDEVYVQVNNVRDNGDIDLGWSIRQSEREFRGVLVDSPDGDYLADEYGDGESNERADTAGTAETGSDPGSEGNDQSGAGSTAPTTVQADAASEATDSPRDHGDEAVAGARRDAVTDDTLSEVQASDTATGAELAQGESEDDTITETEIGAATDGETEIDSDTETRTGMDSGAAVAEEPDRVPVESLRDHVGDAVRLEGEVVSARQTSGPTVFELRDETGVVDCAAFVEAGVRAYPEIETDDVVRLDGEVGLRRDELQVETESLVALEDDEREAVVTRMEQALEDRASPETTEPLADDDVLAAIQDDVVEVATAIRRAILESRPIVVRHDATTDGYVAGAAIERAVLPLVDAEHETADAAYHYFDRRPLEDGIYDMNDATKDVTRMLDDRERHDERLPLFVFAAAGSTAASTDGLELLDVYGAPRVVLDGRPADEAVDDEIDLLATVADRTATTVAANVAAAVNDDVRADLLHLPAISYWDDAPDVYVDLAADAGVDGETARQLREAIALEAFYQSYEDKRELIVDLLFEKRTGLAEQVAEQFETKLTAELDTASANLDVREVDGATVTVLDTDAYTHQYDFPPTGLLLDELHRRREADAVLGVSTDELHVRADANLDLEAVVATAQATEPDAGVTDPGARHPTIEFLAGQREAVLDAVVDAVAEQVAPASA